MGGGGGGQEVDFVGGGYMVGAKEGAVEHFFRFQGGKGGLGGAVQESG